MTKPPVAERKLSPEHQAVLDTAALEELATAKRWLLEHRQAVTPGGLANAVVQARQRANPSPAKAARLEAQRAFKTALLADEERVGERVAHLVERCVAQAGNAPTWGEVGRVMGWDRWQRIWAIRRLARQGWLRTGKEPRSLRPGPRAANPDWRPRPRPKAQAGSAEQ
jgi:hypothetical protein